MAYNDQNGRLLLSDVFFKEEKRDRISTVEG